MHFPFIATNRESTYKTTPIVHKWLFQYNHERLVLHVIVANTDFAMVWKNTDVLIL